MRHLFCGISIFLMVISSVKIQGQNRIMISNDDFGFKGYFFIDDYLYPVDTLDTERMRVTYRLEIISDKLPDNKIEMEYLLQAGVHVTRFLNKSRFLSDSLYFLYPERKSSSYTASARAIYTQGNPLFYYDSFYGDRLDGKTTFTTRLAADDFIYEEVPDFKWMISPDSTETICGYECRKATCHFRGREYEAYYAEDLPISSGPWKFRGLPGLILKVGDKSGLYRYTATNVREGESAIIRFRYPYIRITSKDYLKMFRQYLKNYIGFVNSHIGRTNFIEFAEIDNFKSIKPIEPQELEIE